MASQPAPARGTGGQSLGAGTRVRDLNGNMTKMMTIQWLEWGTVPWNGVHFVHDFSSDCPSNGLPDCLWLWIFSKGHKSERDERVESPLLRILGVNLSTI